jgi:hypothetical protein
MARAHTDARPVSNSSNATTGRTSTNERKPRIDTSGRSAAAEGRVATPSLRAASIPASNRDVTPRSRRSSVTRRLYARGESPPWPRVALIGTPRWPGESSQGFGTHAFGPPAADLKLRGAVSHGRSVLSWACAACAFAMADWRWYPPGCVRSPAAPARWPGQPPPTGNRGVHLRRQPRGLRAPEVIEQVTPPQTCSKAWPEATDHGQRHVHSSGAGAAVARRDAIGRAGVRPSGRSRRTRAGCRRGRWGAEPGGGRGRCLRLGQQGVHGAVEGAVGRDGFGQEREALAEGATHVGPVPATFAPAHGGRAVVLMVGLAPPQGWGCRRWVGVSAPSSGRDRWATFRLAPQAGRVRRPDRAGS